VAIGDVGEVGLIVPGLEDVLDRVVGFLGELRKLSAGEEELSLADERIEKVLLKLLAVVHGGI
jgi:hypothetical protein